MYEADIKLSLFNCDTTSDTGPNWCTTDVQFTSGAFSNGGKHTAYVILDPHDKIKELNEGNNKAPDLSFTVGSGSCGGKGQPCCADVGNKCDNGGDGQCKNNVCA